MEEADGEWKSRKNKRRKGERWRNDGEEAEVMMIMVMAVLMVRILMMVEMITGRRLSTKLFYLTFASDNYNSCGRRKYWLQDLR